MRQTGLLPALFLATSCAVFVPASVAANDAPTVEERLRRLETTVQSLAAENAELRQELGAARANADHVGGPPPIPNGHEARLVVGGFLQAQGEFGDVGDERFVGANDRFYFRRARMFLAGSFAEHFEFKIEGEFAANTLTPTATLKATANEVYVGWNRFPEAIVRIGQLKPAFGGEQLQPETRSPTVERYLGSDRLTDSRQLGMGIGGDVLNKQVSYLYVIGNGNGSNSSANDNSKFMHTARVAGVVFDRADAGRLVLGINGMYSDDDAVSRPGFGFDLNPGGAVDNVFAGRRLGTGADVMWHWGLLDVSAELLRMHFKPRDHLPSPSFTGEGWELMASYFVVPHTLQAVVRRESFDPNTAAAADVTRNWVIGLNYLIKGEDLRLMVDYLFGHADALPNDHGRLLTRFQVIF